MSNNSALPYRTLIWEENHLSIIDQTMLPGREIRSHLHSAGQVWEAIKKMNVRGAPAIGIAGAYGFYMGIRELPENRFNSFFSECERIADYINSSRPTAVNLSWALERQLKTIRSQKDEPIADLKTLALETAKIIHHEDEMLCKAIGEHGASLVPENGQVLTHCNTGGLATAAYGTAFSVIYHAHHNGALRHVWVDETRPLLQGARLTAWELQKADIPFQLIVDSAAGHVMGMGNVDLVITGADRIAANGDTANKIGTYMLAVLAHYHNIPFYVAAPYSTIDLDTPDGASITIEERDPEEVAELGGTRTAPKKVEVYNPAFDVTPGELITGIITEKGVLKPDYATSLKHAVEQS
ncbi:MAG: S-methyl-5-thioribose-1-phosphate isomerase [Balneolaceae bacterium]